ncbi:hypothetical protein KBI23_08925 [bacterium]|nr:hypothetical protein [bacterium]MBP9809238.1 hypothetical protein [bacterium]
MPKHIRPLKRPESGSMLVFGTAITIAIVAVLAFFSLSYVRLLGSSSEQRTAIEAAALAAARDLSMIAVNTDEYGWISLSDSAPIGSLTVAPDQFYVPVRGINTILGTLRLDLIIATELNDNALKEMIKADIVNAKSAQAKLGTELNKAMAAGYKAKGINGQDIDVYGDAQNAYTSNQIRMTGASNYVANSLKLSLGGINNGGVTNTPIPSPAAKANVPSSQQQNNCYLSYMDIPTDGESFVFAGIGSSIKLMDPKQWTVTVAGLPYQVATIVKAEADQHVTDTQNPAGYNIHAIACAQPANVVDPKPTPGALTFSFPDGMPPEILGPGTLLTNAQINSNNNCTYQTSVNGDYPLGKPATRLDDTSWPYACDSHSGNVFRKSLTDWWRRAGTKLNIASATAMLNDPANNFWRPTGADNVDWITEAVLGDTQLYNLGPIPRGYIHIYRVDPSTGLVSYAHEGLTPTNYSVAGENQMYSENIDAITKSAVGKQTVGPFTFPGTLKPGGLTNDNKVTLLDNFDLYIRDQVCQPGMNQGGMHAGEPMDFDKVVMLQKNNNHNYSHDLGGSGLGAAKPPAVKPAGLPPAITDQSDFAEKSGFPDAEYNTYEAGPGTDSVRPTYKDNGMAVDVRFRRQVETGSLSALLGFKIGYVGHKYGATFGPSALPAVAAPSMHYGHDDDDNDTHKHKKKKKKHHS